MAYLGRRASEQLEEGQPLRPDERAALRRLGRDLAIDQEFLWRASEDERRSYIATIERQLTEQRLRGEQDAIDRAKREGRSLKAKEVRLAWLADNRDRLLAEQKVRQEEKETQQEREQALYAEREARWRLAVVIQAIQNPVLWKPDPKPVRPPARGAITAPPREGRKRSKALVPQVDDDFIY
jgi:hypothetical protein